MKKIDIGIEIDLQKLIDTRLLIQAGSGGGKSYLLRKLIESIGNNFQQIIIDPEGEFVTLREKFDFALIAKTGDIPLSLKYAETLAHKLLETNLSAIIDLYELKHHERILFVKRFLDAIINAPKELWHSCFIYVDEAHIFCPESTKSESASSVIDLCTRGRKRGFSAILATQRLSKLHKDAAAECMNKMIGGTGLDIDRKRAGEELGMTNKTDILKLRELAPGEFYGFGPAIKNEVTKFNVSPVVTTHLQSGKRMSAAPPTPKAIEKILSKLSSIPEEAEKELTTKQQLQTEITKLRKELTIAQKQTGAKPIDKDFSKHQVERIDLLKNEIDSLKKQNSELSKTFKKLESESAGIISRLRKGYENIYKSSGELLQSCGTMTKMPDQLKIIDEPKKNHLENQSQNNSDKLAKQKILYKGDAQLGKCERAIIHFLSSNPDRSFSKPQIAVAIVYSPTSSGFLKALSNLSTMQLIIRESADSIRINEQADIISLIGELPPLIFSLNEFRNKLGKCEKEIIDVLITSPSDFFTKDAVADATVSGYSVTSSGFLKALSHLSTLELLERSGGEIRLHPQMTELM